MGRGVQTSRKRQAGARTPAQASRAKNLFAQADNLGVIPMQLVRTGGRMPTGTPGELKNLDVTFTAAAAFPLATLTGVVSACLNGMATGSSAITRLGRRIIIKSIYVRATIFKAATTTGEQVNRAMIVYDKQANATAPTGAQVLLVDSVVGVNDLGNARRFVTLMDKVFTTSAVGGVQDDSHIEFYKKCNLPVDYNVGTAGTVADIQSGSLHMISWNSGGLLTAAPAGQFTIRVRFIDA